MKGKILLVDLNNFARYPSIAIGYIAAVLRDGGYEVDVLAPLAIGLTGVAREAPTPWWGLVDQKLRYRTGVTRNRLVKAARRRYASFASSKLERSKEVILRQFRERLDDGFDVVMISTYLMYHSHCVAIGEICRELGLPMVLGGPYFASEDVAAEWIDTPGLTALIGGEVEPHLCRLVETVMANCSTDTIPGVWQPRNLRLVAPPLVDLDSLPFPDYRGFPWSKYPNVIVPVISGRGCGWGVCLFCSDVTSTAGRTFRSRSPDNVLTELAHQHTKHDCRLFVFTDLKVNSNLTVWRAVIARMQNTVPGAAWIGAVHIGNRGDNGLSRDELEQARASGLVRVTTGLESGSQRVLDSMVKGTDLGLTSRFLTDASRAGISVRATMIVGYPGENASDVDLTASFLQSHENCIERIKLNRMQLMSGTQLAKSIYRKPHSYPDTVVEASNHRQAQIDHHFRTTKDPAYRHAISKLLTVVHRINRKPLIEAARSFEGVM